MVKDYSNDIKGLMVDGGVTSTLVLSPQCLKFPSTELNILHTNDGVPQRNDGILHSTDGMVSPKELMVSPSRTDILHSTGYLSINSTDGIPS